MRAFLILAHEAAVAFDIGTENGGELAFHTYPLPQAIILPASRVRQAAGDSVLNKTGSRTC